ncbi:MAG: ATP-dependent Clp protease ATP-binding subunit [Gammaproteobacteria bacterium]|nr:ATP-dependent Clp protease ATP-binding subunit [Gammaproteobacteria bacterium]MCW5583530.1 ATP-dependent Clp protease ATP-binding subunit [Gammaproteobacteria bacterium]
MVPDKKESFFFQCGKHISIRHRKKNSTVPFKNNPQLPIIVDTLSRKNNHHIVLHVSFSSNFYIYFMEALVQHFTHENIPYPLRGVDIIYLDTANLQSVKSTLEHIEKDFLDLIELLDKTDKYVLFGLSDTAMLSVNSMQNTQDNLLKQQLSTLWLHPKCRFMVFKDVNQFVDSSNAGHQFFHINIAEPSEADIMAILKLQRTELEDFHHILIPEELLGYAYSLTERYISTDQTLEKTLLLLDSSAARIAAIERNDSNSHFKPTLSSALLTNVLSHWTQVPAADLHLHKFKLSEFIQGMQQKIFGQDSAITLLGNELQKSLAHLQQTSSPFCSLLFTGPKHSGKKSTAIALAEQLFKQLNVLYFSPSLVSFAPLNSIMDIRLQRCSDKYSILLRDLIQQIPYAIILFETIETAPASVLDGLQEILSTGYFFDANGKQYNFRQSIIILSTTVGSPRLAEIAKSFMSTDDVQNLDLIQLVMNEKKHAALSTHYYSPQEIVNEVSIELIDYLPFFLCQHVHIVPFLPLHSSAMEEIISARLKRLNKQLDSRYKIELSYAPEVIRYLVDEILKEESGSHAIDINKSIKHIYFIVEQAIFSKADNKGRSNQLYLQLNETGQALCCGWLTASPIRHHAT